MGGTIVRSGVCSLVIAVVFSGAAYAQSIAQEVNAGGAAHFQAINSALNRMLEVAGECREHGSSDLYDCLCAEGDALAKMDTALEKAVGRYPQWLDEIILHDGITLNVPALLKQAQDVGERCAY